MNDKIINRRQQLRNAITNDKTLKKSISDQVDFDAHAGEGELKTLKIDKILLNKHNPRKLNISIDDVQILVRKVKLEIGIPLLTDCFNNLDFTNSLLNNIQSISNIEIRQKYEKLFFLAKSINAQGLIQLISVTVDSDGQYSILAGERRFLAYIMLEKETIRAIVKHKSHDHIKDKTTSLIENIIRENLSTAEKIDFIEELIDDFQATHEYSITAEALSDLINESERSCRRYLRFIDSPQEIRSKIRSGELSTIREIENALRIEKPIENNLSQIIINEKEKSPKREKLGRKKKCISLGKIENIDVIKILIQALSSNKLIQNCEDIDDWSNLEQVQLYWNKIINDLNHNK